MSLGDFNVDFSRSLNKPSHVQTLIENMTRLCFIPIDVLTPQLINHTYVSISLTKVTYKWLDHVWICATNRKLIQSIRITDVQGNTSDHLPIVLQYNFIPNENFGKFFKEIKPKLPTLDHESQHIIHQYSSLVQTKLNDCCKKQLENLKRSNTPEDVVQQTTELLKQITTHLLDSATTLKRNQPKPNLPSNKTKRTRKPWWDEVLSKLHNDVCITYVLYRDSDFNERLKEHFAKAKTNFRKYRRYREKLHHNSKLRS